DGRLERGDRVVSERTDRTAVEPGHPLERFDSSARHELPERGEWIVGGEGRHGQVGVEVTDRDGAGLDARDAGANLEVAAGADPEERIATEPLASLDRLEEIGRTSGVEGPERPERRPAVR